MGYHLQPESLLPPEELDQTNGALILEGFVKNGVTTVLPRWEKKLVRNYPRPLLSAIAQKHDIADSGVADCTIGGNSKAVPLERSTVPLWRKAVAEDCKLTAPELARRVAVVQQERTERKSQEREMALSVANACYSRNAGLEVA